MANNFVRFLRGTPIAYNNLQTKDPDTLYFISEAGASKGVLYLGTKVIAGDSGSGAAPTSLAELTDIIASTATEGMILVKNASDQWEAKSPVDIAASIVSEMVGATADQDGTSGLVPTPKAGDSALFLRGDATWANPVEGVQSDLNTLIGKDSGKSIRQIVVAELTKQLIPENAAESLNELKEIADWIQSHPGDAATLNSKVTDLESKLSELETVSGKVTNLEDILNGKTETIEGQEEPKVTVGLITKVGNLEALAADHTTQINEIIEKLLWHELEE